MTSFLKLVLLIYFFIIFLLYNIYLNDNNIDKVYKNINYKNLVEERKKIMRLLKIRKELNKTLNIKCIMIL